jgi:hypothetical protein
MFEKLYCWWNGHDVQRGDVESGPAGETYRVTPDYCNRCNALDDSGYYLSEWMGFPVECAARIESFYWKVRTGEILCILFGHKWEHDRYDEEWEWLNCPRCLKKNIIEHQQGQEE